MKFPLVSLKDISIIWYLLGNERTSLGLLIVYLEVSRYGFLGGISLG